MKNIQANPLNPLDLWAMRLAKAVSSRFWKPVVVSTLVAACLLGINYFGSQYAVTRAYVIRSISFGIASFLLVAVIQGVILVVGLSILLLACSSVQRPNRKALIKKLWRSGRLRQIALCTLIGGTAFGLAGNVMMTGLASYRYDNRLKESLNAFESRRGCIEFHLPDRKPLLYCRKADGGLTVRDPLAGDVPPQLKRAVVVIEDRGLPDRMFSSNIFGVFRAIVSLALGEGKQGGSSPVEQLAGLMLSLHPRRESGFGNQLLVKMDKVLAGLRLSDLYDNDHVLRLYADRVNIAAIGGYEIQGFGAASVILYNKAPEELTSVEAFDLVALVQGPSRRLPYPHGNEEPAAFQRRKDAQLKRLKTCFEDAVNDGEMSTGEADTVVNSLYSTLRPLSSVRSDLMIPHLGNVFKEIEARVPDASTRYLIVEATPNRAAQIILDNAVEQARAEVDPQLHEWERQALEIDALVVDANGSFIAEVNKARIKGDGCSVYKAFEYCQGLQLGLLSGIDSEVLPGLSARNAIVNSNNPAAESLANRIGPERYKEWLETLGFDVPHASVKNALGAGIDGSPADMALAFHMFGYTNPGFRVARSGFVSSIRDATTNDTLFQRTLVQGARAEVAIAVRGALEETAVRGTAKKLKDLASIAPVAAKTGTSADFKDGRWQGAGGSWIAAIDSQTGVTVVVRMRLRGPRGPLPFRPEGGRSAIIVAREFIAMWRERNVQR